MSHDIRSEPAPTLDEVWRLFKAGDQQLKETRRLMQDNQRDLIKRFQDTDLKIQETDRQLKETRYLMQESERNLTKRFEDTDLKIQETDRQLKETRHLMQESERNLTKRFEDTDLKIQETDRQLKETRRLMQERSDELNKKIGYLSDRLGEFVEALIKPSLVRLFQARQIPVHTVYQNAPPQKSHMGLATQIDFLLINDTVCVVVEVKSRLSIDDVNEHLARMEKFKRVFPYYADKKAYGAVAAMVLPDNVAKYAYRKGLFVIGQNSDTAVIFNDLQFKPVAW